VSIDRWSENIFVADLQDDPAFTDDLTQLLDQIESDGAADVVLNFAAVNYVNSSNIAKLLKLRKTRLQHRRRLILCGIQTNVWGLFLVTGLDKVFEFADDLGTALASIQITTN